MIQLYFDNFRGWAFPWICHCCEFNQSYQWDPSCILCLTCYLPVLKSRIYFKYSILFPMRQVRIDSLYCICHKHQCAFFFTTVTCDTCSLSCQMQGRSSQNKTNAHLGSDMQDKSCVFLLHLSKINWYWYSVNLWLIRIYEVRSKDVATFANLIV